MDFLPLGNNEGFTSGDFRATGYFCVIPAFQQILIADGRPYSADIHQSGYHRIDMINTSLVGAASGEFDEGEIILDAVNTPMGVFIETIGSGPDAKNLIYRTQTTEFVIGETYHGADTGVTLVPEYVIAPPHWLNWTLRNRTPDSYTYEGTADSGGVTSLVDASLITEFPITDYLNNWYIYITAGIGKGSYAAVTDYDATTGTITVSDWLDKNGVAGGTDPSVGSEYGLTLEAPSTGGSFPDGGSNIGCLFDGRIWLNSVWEANQWLASRNGNIFDFDTSQDVEDVQAAMSSQTSLAGLISESIVALIPYKNAYLIFGLTDSMWILHGGSTGAGQFTNLTTESGIFSPDSWCFDDAGNFYFVGMSGFFRLSPPTTTTQIGDTIENISNKLLPDLFSTLKLNRNTDRVVLGYDRDRNLINVTISLLDGTWSVSFVYNPATNSIMPDSHYLKQIPSAYAYVVDSNGDKTGLWIGSYDGVIRQWDETSLTDDGQTIPSRVLFGPIQINSLIRPNAKIKKIEVILSEDSTNLTWALYSAESAEKLKINIEAGATPIATGTFTTGGRQDLIDDKVSGEFIGILFTNNVSGKTWGLERVIISLFASSKEK